MEHAIFGTVSVNLASNNSLDSIRNISAVSSLNSGMEFELNSANGRDGNIRLNNVRANFLIATSQPIMVPCSVQ